MRIRQISSTLPGAPKRGNPEPAPKRDGSWRRALNEAVAEIASREAMPRRRAGFYDDGRPVRPRHYLPFIAQLAAGRIGLPQTRQRRRASPGDARDGYETAGHLSTSPYLGTRRHRAL